VTRSNDAPEAPQLRGPLPGVFGVEPVQPASLEDAQELLRQKKATVFVGGGTRMSIGPPPRKVEQVLSSGKLNRLVEYAPADQIVACESGMTLSALQHELASHGQRLALDPAQPEKQTIGGIIASNAFGPLRTRYGGVRDLIIGISVLRVDGVQAKGGGKVVKNVAGFDLPKLFCGSLGTLGFIASATFRVHPLPEKTETLLGKGLSVQQVNEACVQMREKQLEPAAVVATRTAPGKFDLAVRFEGFAKGVDDQVKRLRNFAPVEPADSRVWGEHARLLAGGPVRLRISALRMQLPQVDAAAPRGTLAFYPWLGAGFVVGEIDAASLQKTREKFATVMESGALDAWGAPPAALSLHKAMKDRFDPQGLLAPGRFVGGI
jgi:glycolate oxidase FAD binding subunit